jgi:hypothetical protein
MLQSIIVAIGGQLVLPLRMEKPTIRHRQCQRRPAG